MIEKLLILTAIREKLISSFLQNLVLISWEVNMRDLSWLGCRVEKKETIRSKERRGQIYFGKRGQKISSLGIVTWGLLTFILGTVVFDLLP